MIASTPSASALVTATVMPRSLKEPVGFCPSHLRYSSMPGATTAARRSARTRGVFPSFSVTTLSLLRTGRRSRKCSIRPPQTRAALTPGTPGRACGARRSAGSRVDTVSNLARLPAKGGSTSADTRGMQQRPQEGLALLRRDRAVTDPRAQHGGRPFEHLRGTLGRERGEPTQRLAEQRELVRPEAHDLAALEAEPRARLGRRVGQGRRGL